MAAADLAVDENQSGTIGSTTGLVVEWPICKFGGRSGDDVGTRNMRLVLIIGSPIDYMLRATSSQLAVNRSSPLTAKASTVDAYSLDHITRSCLTDYIPRLA